MDADKTDQIMEQASQKLVETDYLTCEQLCLEALELAKAAGDYERYARILLPLQEARRQRRQIATDAGVFVLAGSRLTPAEILDQHPQGCLMLISPPYTDDDERAIRQEAMQRRLFVEAIVMDGDDLRACFQQQMEREGDEAVAAISSKLTPAEQVDALAATLRRVGDHEIAHQRLAEAARRAAR